LLDKFGDESEVLGEEFGKMKYGRWVGLGIVFICTYILLEFTPAGQYIESVKQRDRLQAAPVGQTWMHHGGQEREGELMDRIRQAAERIKEAPVDARVDPVWKAIPGYNGLEVDMDRTLALNRSKPRSEPLKLVMREVEPDVQLEDLGAHPIYRGNPKKNMVGLMINVAWGDEYLPGMLDVLQANSVPATFFFDGSWLNKHLDTAKQICAAGHECSNHAYSHPNMSELSRARQTEEIMKTERLLRDELGVHNRLFAPPSGDYNQMTVEVAYELGLHTVLWTIDTVDWKKPDPAWIVRRISSQLEPGSLILMHPTESSSKALPDMIRVIIERGYMLGTVSEVLSSERIPDIEAALNF
jgi:probable sporulation protein (polysaccharide deacetylase family)